MKFLKSWFGPRKASGPKAKKKSRDDRIMKLKIRCKGMISAITAKLPPANVIAQFKMYVEEGNYFPDEFLFKVELEHLEFNDVGGIRRITGDRSSLTELFANFVFVRVLVPHIIQYPWECGLGRLPSMDKR